MTEARNDKINSTPYEGVYRNEAGNSANLQSARINWAGVVASLFWILVILMVLGVFGVKIPVVNPTSILVGKIVFFDIARELPSRFGSLFILLPLVGIALGYYFGQKKRS